MRDHEKIVPTVWKQSETPPQKNKKQFLESTFPSLKMPAEQNLDFIGFVSGPFYVLSILVNICVAVHRGGCLSNAPVSDEANLL